MGKVAFKKVLGNILKRMIDFRELELPVTIIVLAIALSFSSPYFLTIFNLFNIASQISMIAIMAVVMAYVIICLETVLSFE